MLSRGDLSGHQRLGQRLVPRRVGPWWGPLHSPRTATRSLAPHVDQTPLGSAICPSPDPACSLGPPWGPPRGPALTRSRSRFSPWEGNSSSTRPARSLLLSGRREGPLGARASGAASAGPVRGRLRRPCLPALACLRGAGSWVQASAEQSTEPHPSLRSRGGTVTLSIPDTQLHVNTGVLG